MFLKQTTLILGAGASHHCGFPLGVPLRDEVLSSISALRDAYRADPLPYPRIGYSVHNAAHFHERGIEALAVYLSSPLARELVPANLRPIEEILAFGDALARASHDSLDRFIRDNPQRQFIGKVLIAHKIFLRMFRFDNGRFQLKNFAERIMGKRRNWYLQLINHIREGATNTNELAQNRLLIVTFNYDLSLERALAAAVGDTERHRGADYRQFLKIYHMNGAPQELPDNVFDAGKLIIECANQLHLVDENANSEVENLRVAARDAIKKSRRVFIFGFHFDEANTQLLEVASNAGAQTSTFCLNFDGHGGVNQRLRQLKVPQQNISSGSRDRPLFIDEAIDNGFLEQ